MPFCKQKTNHCPTQKAAAKNQNPLKSGHGCGILVSSSSPQRHLPTLCVEKGNYKTRRELKTLEYRSGVLPRCFRRMNRELARG